MRPDDDFIEVLYRVHTRLALAMLVAWELRHLYTILFLSQ
jgi:hypothetical protein